MQDIVNDIKVIMTRKVAKITLHCHLKIRPPFSRQSSYSWLDQNIPYFDKYRAIETLFRVRMTSS